MDYKYYLNTSPGHVVAFLDILGFSAMIKANDTVESHSKGFVYNLQPIYNGVLSYFTKERQKEMGIQFLWVSDSIFIATKIQNVSKLIESVQYVVNQVYCSNLSLRGGIATGSLYFEANLWGTSVVNAVALEGKADMPRIIMTKEDFELLSPYMDKEFWIEDIDYFYLDYFNNIFTQWIAQGKDLECMLSVYARCIQDNFDRSNKYEHKKKWSYLANELKRNIIKNSDYINGHCEYTKKRAEVFGIDTHDKSNTDIYLSMFNSALLLPEEEPN